MLFFLLEEVWALFPELNLFRELGESASPAGQICWVLNSRTEVDSQRVVVVQDLADSPFFPDLALAFSSTDALQVKQ